MFIPRAFRALLFALARVCVCVPYLDPFVCVFLCFFTVHLLQNMTHFCSFFTFSLFLLRTLHSLAQIIHYFKYGSKIYNNYQYFVVAALPCSIPIVAKCMQYSTIHSHFYRFLFVFLHTM